MATLIIIFTAYQYLNAIKYLKASGDNSRIFVLSVNKNDIKQIKMPALRIIDLAKAFIEKLAPKYGYKPEDVEIKIIGKRPCEKMYEELMTENEAKIIQEIKNMFTVPLLKNKKTNTGKFTARHTSNVEPLMSVEEIKKLLKDKNIM